MVYLPFTDSRNKVSCQGTRSWEPAVRTSVCLIGDVLPALGTFNERHRRTFQPIGGEGAPREASLIQPALPRTPRGARNGPGWSCVTGKDHKQGLLRR